MKNAIAVIARLGAAIIAALLFAPLLSGAPPQGLRNRGPRGIPPWPHRQTEQAAKARENYTFLTIDEDSLGGLVYRINDSRLAVGFYADAEGNGHSFFWWKGQLTNIRDYPGASITQVSSVNNQGLMFGSFGTVDLQQAGVLHLGTKTWTLLPDIPGKPINAGWEMNDHGIAVGNACEYDSSTGITGNCVAWTWDGKAYSFTTFEDYTTNNYWEGTYGINDRGDEVGTLEDKNSVSHAYLLSHSGLTVIDVPGAIFTKGKDINSSGEVLLFGVLGPEEGFRFVNGLWRNGVFTPLPDPPDAFAAEAFGLNDRGDYCGIWWEANWYGHGFVALRK